MKHHRFNKCAIALALFGSGVTVQAEEPVKLNEITVKGEAMKESDRSFTVNVISADTIQSQRWENPLAIFEEVPGVEGRSNQSGSVAPSISIRGLSSGGHGGDLGFSLDGITMNEAEGHADGFAETNVIIPLELESLTVYKGPVSPLYGNFARGGVMAFTTRKGGRYADAHLATGAFETNDGQAAFGTKIGAVQLNGAVQGYESEGWRDNSRFSKTNTAFRGAYSLSERSEVALSLRGHGATFEGPGNITRDQFLDDDRRSQQAPTLVGRHDGGEKKYSSQRVDFNHLINDKMKLLTFVYNTKMDITRFESSGTGTTPQIERSHDRDVIAFGGSLNGEHRLFDVATHWVLGTERYNEETHENQWQTTARTRGVKDRDRDFIINTTSLYGQMDLDVHPRFRPTLGFRFDGFDGSLKNRLNNTETDLNDFNRLSPKLGVRSELASNWELRASVANGFGLPSSTQKYDPTINVDAVEFWQYEIGINGAPSPQWYMDLAAFVLDSSDEIQQVPNSVPPEFINAGE
ncbi:MAG: TonB-dependent receptor, partial [Pseudomonadota bacterium]